VIRLIDDTELLARLHDILEADTELVKAKRQADLRRWIHECPDTRFVGSTVAAEILGIHAPHIARIRSYGEMPEPILVEGGYPVYLRGEIEELARKRAERKAA
jgi:hypothetical protein